MNTIHHVSWLHQMPKFAATKSHKTRALADVSRAETTAKTTNPATKPLTALKGNLPFRRLIAAVDCTVLANGGWLIPKGSVIPAYTTLPPLSLVGDHCVFGEHCTLMDKCQVGNYCTFAGQSAFIGLPEFGHHCVFGQGCDFSAGAHFGAACVFAGQQCFAFDSHFGQGCVFATGSHINPDGLVLGEACVWPDKAQACLRAGLVQDAAKAAAESDSQVRADDGLGASYAH